MRRMINSWTMGSAVFILLVLAEGRAAAETRVWTLTEEKSPPLATLSYGVPETDDTFGTLSCTPHSGFVTLFLPTTSGRLKPGRRATAVVSVGKTRAKITGKLTTNEEAGVPSFEGRLDARDGLLAALGSGETLTVVVGPAKQSAPLAGQSEKFGKFAAACAKP